jgi:hypothetical protein
VYIFCTQRIMFHGCVFCLCICRSYKRLPNLLWLLIYPMVVQNVHVYTPFAIFIHRRPFANQPTKPAPTFSTQPSIEPTLLPPHYMPAHNRSLRAWLSKVCGPRYLRTHRLTDKNLPIFEVVAGGRPSEISAWNGQNLGSRGNWSSRWLALVLVASRDCGLLLLCRTLPRS